MDTKPWLAEICNAVGPRFPDADRLRFANAVLKQLSFSMGVGMAMASINANRSELQAATGDVLTAFRRFRKAVSRGLDGEYIDSFVRGQLDSDRVWVIDLAAVESYLSAYYKETSAMHVPPLKTGPNNRIAIAICAMVAAQYALHFGRNPKHSKGGKRESKSSGETKILETPFDRVCNVIERLLKELGRRVSLTDPARAEAVRRIVDDGPLVH